MLSLKSFFERGELSSEAVLFMMLDFGINKFNNLEKSFSDFKTVIVL